MEQKNFNKIYINGEWVVPSESSDFMDLIDLQNQFDTLKKYN